MNQELPPSPPDDEEEISHSFCDPALTEPWAGIVDGLLAVCGQRISAERIDEDHYKCLLGTLIAIIESIGRKPWASTADDSQAASPDPHHMAEIIDEFVAAECDDLNIPYAANQPSPDPHSLNAILHRDRKAIIQSIRAVEPYHVLTFEILTNPIPHRFSIHYSGQARKHIRLYTTEFTSPVVDNQVGDWTFFDTFAKDIRRLIVRKLFPMDASDFYVMQMVRDDWRPCGDFA